MKLLKKRVAVVGIIGAMALALVPGQSEARFNSVDPLQQRFPAWSQYVYAKANPYLNIDPDGRASARYDVSSFLSVRQNLLGWAPNWVKNVIAPVDPMIGPSAMAAGGRNLAKGAIKAAAEVSEASAGTRTMVQKAANKAEELVVGKGHVAGTQKHKAFADELNANPDFKGSTEVSYQARQRVEYGTKESIRVDALEGTVDAPTKVYDLKTGNSKLTPAREAQIRENLPPGSKDIPIEEIRPENP